MLKHSLIPYRSNLLPTSELKSLKPGSELKRGTENVVVSTAFHDRDHTVLDFVDLFLGQGVMLCVALVLYIPNVVWRITGDGLHCTIHLLSNGRAVRHSYVLQMDMIDSPE